MIASRASIQATRSQLQKFYDCRGMSDCTEKSYFVVRGGDITYLFDGGEDSTEFLSEIVNDGSISRRIGTQLIRHARQLWPLFHLVPDLEITSVPVPTESYPGLIILRSRMSVLDFHENTVCKFPMEDNLQMDTAIQTRRKLPSEVNAPELKDVDRTFPFVCEELVSGRTVRNSIDSWPYILSALQNLTHLYRSDELKHISVDDITSKLYDKEDVPIVQQALQKLESLSLPSYLTVGQIHGDLAVRNLRYDGDAVYILDWQDCRRDFLIHDFFRPIHRIASKCDQPEIYTQMVTGVGKPSDIAVEYSQKMGPLAFGDEVFHEGLPLLYLLCALDSPTIGTGGWWKDTVQAVLEELDARSNSRKHV